MKAVSLLFLFVLGTVAHADMIESCRFGNVHATVEDGAGGGIAVAIAYRDEEITLISDNITVAQHEAASTDDWLQDAYISTLVENLHVDVSSVATARVVEVDAQANRRDSSGLAIIELRNRLGQVIVKIAQLGRSQGICE